MNRRLTAVVALALAFALSLTAVSCGPSEVKVRTGLRIVCKYGHIVRDTSQFIFVPVAEAKNYKVRTETTICAQHLQAQKLYGQAQAALTKGKKAKAKSLLKQVAAIDPAFLKTAKKSASTSGKVAVASAASSKSSSGSSGKSSSSGKGSSGGSGTSSGTYLSRIPRSVSGYKLISQSEDALSGTRLFAARSTGYPVKLLTINVTWIGKRTSFATWYRSTIASHYSVGARNVRVGRYPGRLGTDGRQFALVAWPEGGLVFQVEMQSRSGNPSGLAGYLTGIANKM